MHGTIIAVVLVGVLLLASRTTYGTAVMSSKFVQIPRQVWDSVGIMSLLKMVFSYYQIIFLVKDVYDIPFPKLYLDFLYQYISFFSIDWVQMGRLQCLRAFNHYDQLLFFSVVMIILQGTGLAVDIGGYVMSNRPGSRHGSTIIADGVATGRDGAQEKLSKYASRALIIAYFLYSPCCAKIFATFNCRSIDRQDLLRADYSENCAGAKHLFFSTIAVLFIILIPVGLPIILMTKLYKRRSELASEKHLRFFFHDYTPAFWWWECTEITKRLLLVGVSVFFGQGGLMQIALSIIVVVTYLLLLLHFRPFQQRWHGVFALVVNTFLFFSLFAGLFVKLDAGYESKGIFDELLSTDILSAILISCAVSVALIFIGSIVWQSSTELKHIQKCRGHLARIFLPREAMTRNAQFASDAEWLWSFVVNNEEAIEAYAKAQSTMLPRFLKDDASLFLHRCEIREDALRLSSMLNKYLEYQQKYCGSNAALFSLDDVNFPTGEDVALQRQVVLHWSSYPAYLHSDKGKGAASSVKEAAGAGGRRASVVSFTPSELLAQPRSFAPGEPRVCVAFSVVPSVEAAKSILSGNLHNLSARDPGWYGKGIYLSPDPEYCLRWYGRRGHYSLVPHCDWQKALRECIDSHGWQIARQIDSPEWNDLVEKANGDIGALLASCEKLAQETLAEILYKLQQADGLGLPACAQKGYAMDWLKKPSVVLMAYAVAIGNSYLVRRKGVESLLGTAMTPKADSHLVLLTGPWGHGTATHPMSEEGDALGLPQPGAPVPRALQPAMLLTLEGQLASDEEDQALLAGIPRNLAGLLCSSRWPNPPGSQCKSLFGSSTTLEDKMKAVAVYTEGPTRW